MVLAALATIQGASREPARARQGMVASADAYASTAGVDILRTGGNAVDAALGVGFALAVTYPSAGNIGGGGFMVIRLTDGRETTIDYRETAPAGARRDMFLDAAGNPVGERSLVGPLAAGEPGSVAGPRARATQVRPAAAGDGDGAGGSTRTGRVRDLLAPRCITGEHSGAVFPVPVDRSHVSAP